MGTQGGPATGIGRRIAVIATVVGAAILVAAAGVGAAPAGTPQAGYWWQPEPVSGLIPVPGVPSNGLYVASTPTGPQAESAIRFDLADSTAFVELTLHVSNQERVGKPSVIAYPATSRWQTGGPQPWSARPSYRASAKPTRGVFSHNGTILTLTFPAQDAATGIVLVPDPNASNQSFTIAFAPPRSADIVTRRSGTPSPSASSSAGPHSHSPTPSPHGSHHSPSSSHSPHPSKSPKPATKSPTPTTTDGGSPAPTASPTAPSASSGSSGHGTRDGVLVAVVVLVVAGIYGGVVARRRRT